LRVRVGPLVLVASLSALALGCESIDPGANYVVPLNVFNANYFYCYVEPQLIFGKHCGDDGNGNAGCHYSDKIPGMALVEHPPVTCADGVPTDQTQVGTGSPAATNYSAVSGQMSTDYMNAGIYIYPTSTSTGMHPLQVYKPTDPVVMYIATWATE
jgi:hypothetical protein